MAVAFDAAGTSDVTANAVTTKTFANLTVGAGSQRALVVAVCFCSTATSTIPTGITATWDSGVTNQAMTAITGASASLTSGTTFVMTTLFGLIAPASGAKTLSVSWTNSATVYIDAISFTGVDPAGGALSFRGGTNASANSTTPSVTVPSAPGNYVVGAHTMQATLLSVDNTQLFLDNTAAGGKAAANYAVGDTSVALGASISSASGILVQAGSALLFKTGSRMLADPGTAAIWASAGVSVAAAVSLGNLGQNRIYI